MRVDANRRHAAPEELVYMLPQKARSVTEAKQGRVTDVNIHPAGAHWEVVEVMRRPIVDGVVLDECQGLFGKLDDPQGEPGIPERF